MREAFKKRRRRIPILHRDGFEYLLSPATDHLTRVVPAQFHKFGPYKRS